MKGFKKMKSQAKAAAKDLQTQVEAEQEKYKQQEKERKEREKAAAEQREKEAAENREKEAAAAAAAEETRKQKEKENKEKEKEKKEKAAAARAAAQANAPPWLKNKEKFVPTEPGIWLSENLEFNCHFRPEGCFFIPCTGETTLGELKTKLREQYELTDRPEIYFSLHYVHMSRDQDYSKMNSMVLESAMAGDKDPLNNFKKKPSTRSCADHLNDNKPEIRDKNPENIVYRDWLEFNMFINVNRETQNVDLWTTEAANAKRIKKEYIYKGADLSEYVYKDGIRTNEKNPNWYALKANEEYQNKVRKDSYAAKYS